MKTNKWLLLVGLMVLMTPVANAQLRFGVKGGVNISSVKFNKDIIDSDNMTGFHIGPTIELGGMAGLGLDAAVLYSQKGFKYKGDSYKNDYLEIPINLKYKFGMLPLVKPFAAVGPYFGFRVAGDKLWDVGATYNGVIDQIKTKSFSSGLNLGIGAEVLNMVQIGLTYSWGFTDNYKLEDFELESSSGKNRQWSISAAVFF